MDKAWWISRLAAGIISIILAAAVFILEVYVCIIGSFSMTGPDGSEGKGFIFVLIFLVSGILAIILNKNKTGPLICAGLYGLGFLIAVYIYGRYDYTYIYQSMSLYGLICLVFADMFLFSVCRTWKPAIILGAVTLALIGSGVLVIQIQKQLDRREQQKKIEMQRAYEEKVFQVFDARTPEEIAFDHLSYYRGMSKTQLINLLETRDGMSFDTAQKLADSLDVDWELHALYRSCMMVARYMENTVIGKDEKMIRDELSKQGFSEKEIEFALQNLDEDHFQDYCDESKYFSGMIYSDVNREDYGRYYKKWL